MLHTGVASLESSEPPYPEYYRVTRATAHRVNDTRREGGRVIAIGTTVVRALETVVDARGEVHAGSGWTDTIVTPEHPVTSADGLLTGWHEPEASHLAMLEAVAGRPVLERSYAGGAGRGLSVARVRRRPPDRAVTEHDGAVEAPLATMPTTRRAILTALKRNGSMRATTWPTSSASRWPPCASS